MKFVEVLSHLATQYNNPFFELPGYESQKLLSPIGREEWLKMNINYRESGVMVFLFPDENQDARITLFQRKIAEGMAHSGQIGLPGGKYEQQDVNIIQTAVRETYEEIGVQVESDRIIGRLTAVKIPVSGFELFPIIGFADEMPQFKIEEQEVEQLVHIKVGDLRNAEVLTKEFETTNGKMIQAPYFQLNGFNIWGATAMVLSEFRSLL